MRMIAVASFAAILAAPLAAQAAAAQAPCLRPDMVKGWNVLDDNTLIVADRMNQKFRLSLTGACHDLQFQTALAFKAFGGGNLSCVARNDSVLAPPPIGNAPAQRCLIMEIREYTAAMENADEMAEGTLHHHPDTNGEIGAIP